MSCCAPGVESSLELDRSGAPSVDEVRLASRSLGGGLAQVDFAVPGVHCGACIRTVETALQKLPGVVGARVNLSTKRVSVRLREGEFPPLVATLYGLGYEAHLFDRENDNGKDPVLAELIRAVAIAGFAATNIMLLSVSVWSGATDATRDLFHWVSALIAIPALAFAGRIYFRSAWSALSHGRMNMDVPIAIGITLAYGLSLYETINHGPHAYFDASVSLLFFLLIGRTLDHVMREKARTAVSGLRRLAARGATVVAGDGTPSYVPVEEIARGDVILVAAGERVPVDALVMKGASEVDRSLVSGESEPETVDKGAMLQAGTLNLTGALTVEATAAAKDSFLAEMVRLMEAAEGGRARYRRIADKASALYAPVVHLTALLTFFGWLLVSGDWHRAMIIAIAVLIITCPCALGLAVPIVQVVAARRLFEQGIMVKDGSAMERLAGIDTVLFDKTGTLTLGALRLANVERISPADMVIAAQLAAHSRHPVARAITETNPGASMQPHLLDAVSEVPGFGLEASMNGSVWRLGRAQWALKDGAGAVGTVLSRDGVLRASFVCEDRLRAGAAETVTDLAGQGLVVEMLTGDHSANAKVIAAQAGIDAYRSGMLPGEKVARIAAFADKGRKVLMIGDGLNDAPALAAAHVSMAPATAADIGRNAADFVFLRENLTVIPFALDISRKAGRLIRQNLAFAIAYNFVAVPIAIFGYVTPLIAAIAMSLSSIIVIANAMRLAGGRSVAEEEPRVAVPARLIERPVQ
ncbi:cation-translocating P-type ATPase [Mesorhizobium sp. 1M-11]|uniref:cation-translocating P-type ATPase n=1 Tax=Mesorhizobium sp. 1M-11 TaxID=1529006 RepID=UPI0006C75CB6|nr:cation-translocating P-type ATPase [Mesorhizobium sp. 1M-11]